VERLDWIQLHLQFFRKETALLCCVVLLGVEKLQVFKVSRSCHRCMALRLIPFSSRWPSFLIHQLRLAGDWCWFVLREKYCWLVAGGWFILREKYCWLVADKRSEQAHICVSFLLPPACLLLLLFIQFSDCCWCGV
jgi:hypothetical protein